jgi:hypothetical protein
VDALSSDAVRFTATGAIIRSAHDFGVDDVEETVDQAEVELSMIAGRPIGDINHEALLQVFDQYLALHGGAHATLKEIAQLVSNIQMEYAAWQACLFRNEQTRAQRHKAETITNIAAIHAILGAVIDDLARTQ